MRIVSARFVRSVVETGDFIDDGLREVAFVGRSNVGKSSLLNRLLGRKTLARISSTPGRTRAVNYFLINESLYFVDLPGYGYARVAKSERREWAQLMEEYFRQAVGRTMVVQIVDSKVGATDLDVQAWDYLRSLGLRPLVVATKADRLSHNQAARARGEIHRSLGIDDGDARVVSFSARSGLGVGELWGQIDGFVGEKAEHRAERGMNHG